VLSTEDALAPRRQRPEFCARTGLPVGTCASPRPYLAYDEVGLRRRLHQQWGLLRPVHDPPLRDPRVGEDRPPVRGPTCRPATTATPDRQGDTATAGPGSTSRWKRSSTTSSCSPKAFVSRAGETYVAIRVPLGVRSAATSCPMATAKPGAAPHSRSVVLQPPDHGRDGGKEPWSPTPWPSSPRSIRSWGRWDR